MMIITTIVIITVAIILFLRQKYTMTRKMQYVHVRSQRDLGVQ